MDDFYLALSWSISRGRDTYGYNICRLEAPAFQRQAGVKVKAKRYRCHGGGYDMTGTVVADWLCDRYRERLVVLARTRAHTFYDAQGMNPRHENKRDELYGLVYYSEGTAGGERASMDGACGLSSVERVAAAIGVSLSQDYRPKGRGERLKGFMVTDYGSAEAMAAATNQTGAS